MDCSDLSMCERYDPENQKTTQQKKAGNISDVPRRVDLWDTTHLPVMTQIDRAQKQPNVESPQVNIGQVPGGNNWIVFKY